MTEQNIKSEEIKLLSSNDFFFETPLYECVEYTRFKNVASLFLSDIDAYSVINNSETTYKINFSLSEIFGERNVGVYSNNKIYRGFAIVSLSCRRKNNDTLWFFIYKDEINEKITKIGQYPSLVDLQFAELDKKYNKILN